MNLNLSKPGITVYGRAIQTKQANTEVSLAAGGSRWGSEKHKEKYHTKQKRLQK